MDYKKIIVYLIVALAVFGYWYKTEREEMARSAEYERFAAVYAGTAVVAELYRNEPERFLTARDSIYSLYNLNSDSIEAFKSLLENREEEWSLVWGEIKRQTDSLIAYFQEHPVEHDMADSAEIPADSAVGQ